MEVEKFRLVSQVDDKRWKTADDLWSLDFPKVCMEAFVSTGALEAIKGGGSRDFDSEVFRSEMLALLASARQKVVIDCRRPCCTEEQGRFFGVAPWGTIESGLGYRSFSQDAQLKGDPDFSAYGGFGSEQGCFAAYSWPVDTVPKGQKHLLSVGDKNRRDKSPTPGPPHEALNFVLPYLVLKDRLVVEQVCKTLKDAVSQDYLWRRLRVENPLNLRLSDEILLQLAARGQGELRSLVLIDCMKISDAAVEQVVAANPKISRICLLNCVRINGEAVVRMARVLFQGKKSRGMPGLQRLQIRGIAGISRDDYEQLEQLLEVHEVHKQRKPKPRFFPSGDGSDRVIDLEACPRCKEARIVYDCTRESCLPDCRACHACIFRCNDCGVCLENVEYEETFNLLNLCGTCTACSPKCVQCGKQQEGPERLTLSSGTFVCPDCASPYTGKAAGLDFYVM